MLLLTFKCQFSGCFEEQEQWKIKMSYYSILKHEKSFTLTFLGFCQNFQNTCLPRHLEGEASVYVKGQNFENYIIGKSQQSSLPLFLPDMNFKGRLRSVRIWLQKFVKEG